MLEKNPDLFVRFTRAIHKGQLWVNSHSAEEVAEVIAPFFPLIEHDILVEAWASISPSTPGPDACDFRGALYPPAGDHDRSRRA
jgi:ABC-type nitrate/sulfonate/bicarbonate transport system substrate-binding protein